MSAKYEIVKNYYEKGLWTESMVRNAVDRWITAGECEEILGGGNG